MASWCSDNGYAWKRNLLVFPHRLITALPRYPTGSFGSRFPSARPLRETYYPRPHYATTMKISAVTIEDTDENRAICMKYCGICPNYTKNCLDRHQPESLFCAKG